MVNVGPIEVVFVVMLALLALAAVASAVAALGATIVMAVAVGMAPVCAGLVTAARRRRWLRWHPSTRWMPGTGPTDPPEPGRHRGEPMPALRMVCSHDPAADVQVLAADVGEGPGVTQLESPMTMVHARLAPTARLELPGHKGQHIVVYVLDGQGTVGPRRQPVCGGQFAVLEAGEPVSLAAGDSSGAPGLEVLVLGELPADRPVGWAGRMVLSDAGLLQRLKVLQAATANIPGTGIGRPAVIPVPEIEADGGRHSLPLPEPSAASIPRQRTSSSTPSQEPGASPAVSGSGQTA